MNTDARRLAENPAKRAEEIVEGVIREMNRIDLGISVKDGDAHVRARRANAARVVTEFVDAAVAEARREERAAIRHYFTAKLASGHTWTVGEIERAIKDRDTGRPASAPEGAK